MLTRRTHRFDIRDEDLVDDELTFAPDATVCSDAVAADPSPPRGMRLPSRHLVTWGAMAVTVCAAVIVAAGMGRGSETPQVADSARTAHAGSTPPPTGRAEASPARVVTVADVGVVTDRTPQRHAAARRSRHRPPPRRSSHHRHEARPQRGRSSRRAVPAAVSRTPASAAASPRTPSPTPAPSPSPARTPAPSPAPTSPPARPAPRSSSDEFGIEG
jgi:hypothetical protein